MGRVEHRSGEPTSSELSGTTRTGSSGTTSQRPNREAWRTSSPSQAARKESGTRFFGESTRSSQSHLPVPGESSAAPTFLVSQCAESVVDGALDELMALHEEVFFGRTQRGRECERGDREGEGHTPAVAIKDRLFALVGMCPCFRPSSMLFLVKRSSVKSTVGVTGGWIEIFHLMQYGTHGRANFLWLSAIRLFGSPVQTW